MAKTASAAKQFFKLTVSGTQKYAVTPGFAEKFAALKQTGKEHSDDPDFDMPSRQALRQHPFHLGLPPLSISDQLDRAAVEFLRENSVHSVKTLNQLSARLVSSLHERELMSEQQIVDRMQGKQSRQETNWMGIEEDEKDDGDEEKEGETRISKAMQFHTDKSFSGAMREERQARRHSLSTWKSINYSKTNSELYLVGRIAPNFAVACRILYEIRKRCPLFVPHSFFDFASGLGTYAWVANSVWPVGCIREHHLVEPSTHMSAISEFLLRKRDAKMATSDESQFAGVHHRRFMPASNITSDLVMAGYALFELAGEKDRRRVIENLWNRTTGFLVFIEEGTKAGHAALLEARDWLINRGGEDMHIFAPCPHRQACGKAGWGCSSSIRYFKFGLTKDAAYPSIETFSYLVVSRGDWRKFGMTGGTDVIDNLPDLEQEPHPRIVSEEIATDNPALDIDLCLPNGDCERVTFSKSGTNKSLYFFLRNANGGDIAPCQRMPDARRIEVDDGE